MAGTRSKRKEKAPEEEHPGVEEAVVVEAPKVDEVKQQEDKPQEVAKEEPALQESQKLQGLRHSLTKALLDAKTLREELARVKEPEAKAKETDLAALKASHTQQLLKLAKDHQDQRVKLQEKNASLVKELAEVVAASKEAVELRAKLHAKQAELDKARLDTQTLDKGAKAVAAELEKCRKQLVAATKPQYFLLPKHCARGTAVVLNGHKDDVDPLSAPDRPWSAVLVKDGVFLLQPLHGVPALESALKEKLPLYARV